MPIPYGLNYPADGYYSGPFYYVAGRETIAGSSFYLPIYIGGRRNIVDVQLKYFSDDDELLATVNATENSVCPGNPYTPAMGNNG